MYAEVVLDIPGREIDRPFDYLVPAGMPGIVLGAWVRVPFSGREATGWVISLKESTAVPPARVRALMGPVEGVAPLNPVGLALAGWTADRYLASRREALALVTPPGGHNPDRVMYMANPAMSGGPSTRAKRQAAVWAFLQGRREGVGRDELVATLGESAVGAVRTLVASGLVSAVTCARPGITAKTIRVFRLAIGTGPAEAAAQAVEARRPKQAAALRELVGWPEGASTQELQARCVSRSALGALVEQGLVVTGERLVRRDPQSGWRPAYPPLVPNAAQEAALAAIRASSAAAEPQPLLLHGVTGSGKTEVYLQAIAEQLDRGKQAIVLVPEISLTPQMAKRFRGRFGERVAVLHSRLSAGERFDEWQRVAAGEADVVLGARSAVFAPVSRLGIIVVDEEHESSYKQGEAPRYHAREVALELGRAVGAVVVLGSATPAVESYYRALSGEYLLAELPARVVNRPLPEVHLVDMRTELAAGNRSMFSRRLQEGVQDRLDRGEQVILFLNRRGYARVVLCRACGFVARCPYCQVSLTYHAENERLVCHYCDYSMQLPVSCPACGSRYIRHFGVGTERVEEEVHRLFPEARVARMDVDSTRRKGAHARILNAFANGEYNLLVGTQMIGKGLDFPGVTLVGVVAADTALHLPDFRAGERTFQMLTQVAGRAGRGERPGEVVVQTYNPDHYAVRAAASHDYLAFYREEIAFRAAAGYPPFTSLALVTFAGAAEEEVARQAGAFAAALRAAAPPGVETVGPNPAPLSRLRGLYRFQVLAKGGESNAVREVVGGVLERYRPQLGSGVRAVVDVDPEALL